MPKTITKKKQQRVAKRTKLPRFTLAKNKKTGRWELQPENSNRVIKSWSTKDVATASGVLKRAVRDRGSIRIHAVNGRVQEERTYPRSVDVAVIQSRQHQTARLLSGYYPADARVADMTEAKFKSLIKSSVKQSLREMFEDPDAGLELRPEIMESLLQQEKDFASGKRGKPLEEVAKRLGLT